MKGQAKRFVDHTGKAFKMHVKKKEESDNIGFLDLWRYATPLEVAATLAGVVCACLCSCALLAAIVAYGEVTSLFVQRHNAAATTPHVYILTMFGGGRRLPEGNRTLHMDALVEDSVAFGAASAAVMAWQFVTAAFAVTLANWAAGRMVSRLRWRLLRSVISQEVAFFDTNTNMNFAAALTEDMDKLKAGVGEHVAMIAFLGGTVVLGAALALSYGWELTLAGLAVVPVAITVAAVVSKYQTKCSSEEVRAYGSAGRVVEEALTAIRTVRAYAGEEKELERYSAALGGAARASRRRGVWAGAGAGLGWLLTYALNAIVFAYGAVLCVADMDAAPELQRYHPGIMLTILFCTFIAAQNIAMCQPHLETISSARGAARSLFRLLERRPRVDALRGGGVRPAGFRGDICFDNLYFNYPSRPDVKVLRGLTLKVSAGETVALVGGSGCGKSTLLQLLQRLYEPDSGQVAVDGHRLQDLDIHHFRTNIGVVGQEPVLFSGTVRENIALGVDATLEQVVAAAKTANAHGFITKLANGYDTMLGSNGAALSGGQKQRVAIARALVRNPSILLLDEPTSALDPAAERQVQAALDAASKGRTTLVVSHRLSTIVNASRIVYLEQGAVLEQGAHLELLQRRGPYWRLVQDDMTHRSAMAAAAEEEAAGGGDVEAEAPAPLQRAPTLRRSTHREWMVRGSLRMGAIAAAPAPGLLARGESPDVAPEADEVPAASTWALLKLNAPEWRLLVGGAAASLLVGATMPTFALLLSKLYGMFAWEDRALILRESALYAGLFALAAALCGAVTFLQSWLFSRAGAALTDRLRKMCFANYLVQEQAWFDAPANSVGALCARLSSDCAAVQGATGSRLGTVLQGASTMAIGVALAACYSWKMTLVSLLSVPCVMGGICLESYMTRRAEAEESSSLEAAARVATEAVLNVRTVQSLGVERPLLARYSAALAERGRSRAALVRGPVYGLCLCAPTLGYAVSLAYGGYLVAREDLPYAYAVLVAEALIYGAWMLAEALSFAPNFAAAKRSGARILQALARKPSVVSEDTATEEDGWTAQGDLEFSDVWFHYPSRGAPVLRGVTLRLRRGETLALVGASGCGKSTLLQLLQRSYDPERGAILLDGRDTRRSLPLAALRRQLGLVPQEPALFSRSVRDNIAYGDNARHVPLEEVIAAARQANVHAFIAGLPLGYDTVLGSGAALSGGQKQRVGIARALVRDPSILLLDEATSALDANSEKTVQAALEAASRGRSTIVIAHRLATVRHAHTIAVLDKGVVAEVGSHEELVRKRGLYWELLNQQGPVGDT